MSPFGSARLVTPHTRRRKRRSAPEVNTDESTRITLPQVYTLERTPVAPEQGSSSVRFPRTNMPRPTPPEIEQILVDGVVVDSTVCDVLPSTIPAEFGDIEGPTVVAVDADTGVIPRLIHISGSWIRAAQCDPAAIYGIATSEVDIDIDEHETREFPFQFIGGRSSASYLEVSWYATQEDAEARRNPVSESRRPTDVVIRTDAPLTRPGIHGGTLTFTGQAVSQVEELFGRVDIVDVSQVYGDPIAPPPPVPEPPPDIIEGDPIPPHTVYRTVYPTTTPPTFGDIPGPKIPPERCMPIPTVVPVGQVYGETIDPATCDAPEGLKWIYGLPIDPTQC